MLYTLQKAAMMLGITVDAVRKRIARYKVKTNLIETDTRRVYLTYEDLILLMQKPERKPSTNNSSGGGGQLYTIAETALLLGVARTTVKNWIVQDKIEKKKVAPNERFVYLSSEDLILLARKHNRKLGENVDQIRIKRKNDNSNDDYKLYSVKEALAALNSTPFTVRKWIARHNIEKKVI